MSRLFGVRVSDSQLLSCALYPFAKDLVTEVSEDNREGWGLGFYQDDRVLVKKRPQSLKARIDFAELASDLRTQALLGHARRPTSGVLATEDTHPFQFRVWLFAHHGMLDHFEERRAALEEKIPEFLRQHLAGDTDSERLFFLFLTALSTATRQRLEDPSLRPEQVGDAIREALVATQAPKTEQDTLNVIATNGRVMVATGLGRPLYMAVTQGITDCPRCRIPPLVSGREPTRVDHPHLRAVLVASGLTHPDEKWQVVPDRSMVLVDREVNHKVVSL